jgi:hypothetical protein
VSDWDDRFKWVNELGVSNRLRTPLVNHYNSLEHLLDCTPKWVKSTPGLGPKMFKELLEALRRNGHPIWKIDHSDEVEALLRRANEAEQNAARWRKRAAELQALDDSGEPDQNKS